MSYKIMRTPEGEFSVFLNNALIATHSSRSKAEASIKTIYASQDKAWNDDEIEYVFDGEKEVEKQIMRPSQAEAVYIPLSATTGKACANCRWFNSDYCGLIENYPNDVLPTGYCNRWEAIPNAPDNNTQLAALVGDAVAGAITPLTMKEADESTEEHETPEVGYIAPDSNSEGVFKSLVDKFKRGLKPGMSVMKGVDGARYMLIVTSNSYQDRDSETLTTPALKEWVDTCWKSIEDHFTTDNPLLYWHDDRVQIGTIVWADMRGPFLVEIAKESANPLSSLLFDYRESNPHEKWGASHRFAYLKSHKDKDGTYHHIQKRETSILPRDAAANLLTFSGVIPMTTKRDEFLNKMLNLPNAAELLDKGIEVLVDELKKNGVEHKAVEGEKPVTTENPYANLLADMIKAQAEMAEQLDTQGVEVTAVKAANETLVADNKALKERVNQAEIALKSAPRMASRATETEIEADSLNEDIKKSLVKKSSVFGLKVSP